jgi:hypothetical protein
MHHKLKLLSKIVENPSQDEIVVGALEIVENPGATGSSYSNFESLGASGSS